MITFRKVVSTLLRAVTISLLTVNCVTHLTQTQVHVYVSEYRTEPHPDVSNIYLADSLFLRSSNYFFDSDILQGF